MVRRVLWQLVAALAGANWLVPLAAECLAGTFVPCDEPGGPPSGHPERVALDPLSPDEEVMWAGLRDVFPGTR